MPKCKVNSTSKPGAEEPNSHEKSSADSPPLSSSNVSSLVSATVSPASNAAELSRTKAILKALEDRFAQVLTENQTLQAQNKGLQLQLIQQKQNSNSIIENLSFEVDELKTELTVFRCDSIMKLSLNQSLNDFLYV